MTEKTDIRDSDEKVVEIEMERLGYKKIPVIIRMMQDDEAVVTMVDYNLQREQISVTAMPRVTRPSSLLERSGSKS